MEKVKKIKTACRGYNGLTPLGSKKNISAMFEVAA